MARFPSWLRVGFGSVAVVLGIAAMLAWRRPESPPRARPTITATTASPPEAVALRALPSVALRFEDSHERAVSDPGTMTCGTDPCNLATSSCCMSPTQAACVARTQGCPADLLQFECDEAADCPKGHVCCVLGSSVRCAPTCDAEARSPFRQLCKHDGECASGACVRKRAGQTEFWSCR